MRSSDNTNTGYIPEVCCYCGSGSYTLIADGPNVPVIACVGCGLMRQGFLGTGKRSLLSYAGGETRYLKQRKEKEAVQVVDYLKILPRLEKYVPEKSSS